jgi:hypothetical protein
MRTLRRKWDVVGVGLLVAALTAVLIVWAS